MSKKYIKVKDVDNFKIRKIFLRVRKPLFPSPNNKKPTFGFFLLPNLSPLCMFKFIAITFYLLQILGFIYHYAITIPLHSILFSAMFQLI